MKCPQGHEMTLHVEFVGLYGSTIAYWECLQCAYDLKPDSLLRVEAWEARRVSCESIST
jgi:hypothetical protein